MLFAAFAAALWNPQRPAPIAAGAATVVLAALSSPFGLFLAPLAVLRVCVFRRSRAVVIPLCILAGAGIQALIMALRAAASPSTPSCRAG